MATFNANDIIGKSLIAKATVKVYDNYNGSGSVIRTVSPGQTVGVVFSWVKDAAGNLWWQLEGTNEFVKHVQGVFDVQSLVDQGTLTDAQKAALEAEKNKDTFTKVTDFLSKNIKTVAIIGGAAAIAVAFIKSKKK